MQQYIVLLILRFRESKMGLIANAVLHLPMEPCHYKSFLCINPNFSFRPNFNFPLSLSLFFTFTCSSVPSYRQIRVTINLSPASAQTFPSDPISQREKRKASSDPTSQKEKRKATSDPTSQKEKRKASETKLDQGGSTAILASIGLFSKLLPDAAHEPTHNNTFP